VQADGVGFPDLILVKGPRLLAVELKRELLKPGEEQILWLDAFARVPGVEAYVWIPSEWLDGTIAKILQGTVGR
jgi:hypothetical protein